MRARPTDRMVFSGRILAIGEFRCPPGHEAWSSENRTSYTIAVFPRTPVWIAQEGREPVVADPNRVMFYNAGQAYRRALLSSRGDECEFFAVQPEVVAEIAAAVDPAALERPAQPFAFGHGPSSPRDYLRQRALYARACAEGPLGALGIEEEFLELLAGLILAAYSARGTRARPRPRDRTAARHAELAEAVKEVLARRAPGPLRLDEISDAVESSPFHLCRVFRAHSGTTIHQYVLRLRLCAALERLADPREPITRIALESGFSSHAHFTGAFARQFGLSPSQARRRLGPPGLRALSKNMEAGPRAAG